MQRIVVTGGAGFIGSNFARYYLREHPNAHVHVLDALTYAGNPANFADLLPSPRFSFTQGSIADRDVVREVCSGADAIVNFAAESHNDRTILNPDAVVQTNVGGVQVLLDFQRTAPGLRLLHISTDEVYGSRPSGEFHESDALQPNQPYSAGKAGGELMARAYHVTFGADVVVTRGSNTFGPYQYPEKIMPLFITNLIDGESVPVYGDGLQVRDWLYVDDHCRGIDIALEQGTSGEAYNIGGGNEVRNIDLTHRLLALTGRGPDLIKHVEDRPGHDWRYSIATSKLNALGYRPQGSFEQNLAGTVEWYQKHQPWWRAVKASADYQQFTRRWYANR